MPEHHGLRRIWSSVRFRITLLAALAALVVLLATSIALVVSQRRLLIENLDEQISVAADEVADDLATGAPGDLIAAFGDDDSALQVVSADDEVLTATPNIAGAGPLAAPPPTDVRSVVRTASVPHDDSRFRVVSVRTEGSDGPVVVHAAATLDDVADSTNALTRSLVVVVPATTLVLAGVVWWLVGRTLAPVEVIRRDVASIGGADLHRRVPEPRTGDEIDRLAHTMNQMLSRLEEASHQQRRFVDDASHELRSPLTRMRTELEVDITHPEHSDPVATHRSLLEETINLQHLVEDLLALARLDAGAGPARSVPLDLDDVVIREVARVHPPDGIEIHTDASSTAEITGDAEQLTRVVRNLVENASGHARSTVTVHLAADGDDVVLTVADDGPGIPAGEHEHVFDRFSRLDQARSRDLGGTGLGLAITKAIVEAHGGVIGIEDQHPGAGFVVRLPIARASR